jgi:hypothetical protein
MSPKVIIRQNGVLVNNRYEPIEAQLKELKRQIRARMKEGVADKQSSSRRVRGAKTSVTSGSQSYD